MSMIEDGQKAVELVIGAPSPWRWPRIILGVLGTGIVFLLWKCSEIVGPEEQALRTTFGRVKFIYNDDGEPTRWRRHKARRHNKRKVRELRRGSDSNKPYLQLAYGSPKVYGPGRYLKIPFTISYIKEDSTSRNIDTSIFIEWAGQFRGADQPIQLVVRVASVFLWRLSGQDIPGTLKGIADEKFREIQEQLGADRYSSDAVEVKRLFFEQAEKEFTDFGAEILRINIAKAVPRTEGWLAQAIAGQSPSATPALAAAIAVTHTTNGLPDAPKP